MPCNSDYLTPTQREVNTRKVSNLLVYVMINLGEPVPEAIAKSADDTYGYGYTLEEGVPKLCGLLKAMTAAEQEKIIYNPRDKRSRELATWWEEHQAADKAREFKEQQDQSLQAAKARALQKLSSFTKA